MNGQAPTAHQAAGFDPGVTLDDDFATSHAMSNEVEAIARAFDPDSIGISCPHAKHIPDGNAMPRGVDRRPLDFRDRLGGKQVRHQWRQIESLIGPMSKRQHQRSHDSKSFKWKWYGPSLPP
jgi:hypothetical protein